MKTTDFIKMLEIGLGRAVIYAQQHDMSQYRDVILDACLHCQSANPQMEGVRAAYMFMVINETPDVAWYREQVLIGLAALTDDDGYDVAQRYNLVGLLLSVVIWKHGRQCLTNLIPILHWIIMPLCLH